VIVIPPHVIDNKLEPNSNYDDNNNNDFVNDDSGKRNNDEWCTYYSSQEYSIAQVE
jgi:hypothetical protein